MRRTISEKTREQAADICALSASDTRVQPMHHAAAAIGASLEALELAVHAWSVADWLLPDATPAATDATAEALLRSGWHPEDYVPLLRDLHHPGGV